MCTVGERTRKDECSCCKSCRGCTNFQKILDLNNIGLILYRHTNRIDEVNKTTGRLESSINTIDDVFIIQNTKDIQIKPFDCISAIEEEIICPRCRALVQRAQKYLRNIPSIDKKKVISVCDHCKSKSRTCNYCSECHKVVKKFLAEHDSQNVKKERIKSWLSKVHKLLKNMSTDRRLNKGLKYRAQSELYLNSLLKHSLSTRELQVEPIVEMDTVMSELPQTIDDSTAKSDSDLMHLDYKSVKLKSVVIKTGSFIQLQSNTSSSITAYHPSLGTETDKINEKIKAISTENKFSSKRDFKSLQNLIKCYSEEEIYIPSAVLLDYGEDKDFKFVFPKAVNNKIEHLRRVKTSMELIADTQEKMRSRTENERRLETPKSTAIQIRIRKRDRSKKGSQSKTTSDDDSGKETRKDRLAKLTKSDKEKLQKEEQKSAEKKKVNVDQIKKEKQENQKEKQEQIRKEKEDKQRMKQDQLLKEKEDKLKLKDEQKKGKEENLKKRNEEDTKIEKPPKGEDLSYIANLKKIAEEQQKAEKANIQKQKEDETKMEKKPKTDKTQKEPSRKELSIKDIKMRSPSADDLILKLVQLKQTNKKDEKIRPQRLSEINITSVMINEHKVHKGKKEPSCTICLDSELELDVENILNNMSKPDGITEVIVGNKIRKSKFPLSEKLQPEEKAPILYKSLFNEDEPTHQEKETDRTSHKPRTAISQKYTEQELPKGVIRYALSDRSFIEKGWTMLPTEKVVRKMNVYRMRPAHPEFDWFDHNKNKRLMLYDTGEKLAEFDDNGRGRWFYRNGRLALDYYDAEEMNAQQRIVIYGSGEPDERGRYQPIALLATFDYLGNGVVFDHAGKIRLKYNQTEGVVLDRGIGPVSHWKWHTLNDPPVLQQVMIDTQVSHKDPEILKLGGPGDDKVRPDNEEMLAIEFDNFIKEKSKKLSQKFKPFQIRTKALKINEHFSLRVLDQANIYLIFRDGKINIKMNIGMILDHQEIVDTDTAEVGEVSNNLERFPARTDSLAGLQRSVAHAQRVERLRIERERRLRHPEPSSSADQLVAAASRPLRSQLHIMSSSSSVAQENCYCKCRKPSGQNIYYDTRLI